MTMAIEDHATTKIDGIVIPLIGVPPESSRDKCDACKTEYEIRDLFWDLTKLICPKCREKKKR